MAQLPVAGPSQPSSATKKSPKPRSASKSKPRAPDVGSAATSPVRPHATEMDVDESPAAESSTAAMNGGLLSTLGPHTNGFIASTSKRKHRHGNKESKGVGPSETPRKRYQREGVEECACIPIARAGVSSIPPVWSRDSRFYFTVSDTSIFVHSATAPAFTRSSTLSSTHPEGHKGQINAIALSPLNPFHLVSASSDGSIKIWNWVEGKLLSTFDAQASTGVAGLQISHLCHGQVGGKWWIFFASSTPKKDKQRHGKKARNEHRIWRLPLHTSDFAKTRQPFPVGKLSSQPASLFISPSHTYIVALAGTKAYTYRLPVAPKAPEWPVVVTKFVSDQPFTCGAFAPAQQIGQTKEEEWFATGDVKGVIRLWHGLEAAFRQIDALAGGEGESSDIDRRLPTTSLHWHAHAVSALAFTASGAQLLSVGEESVLVQWHIGTGRREFAPRLGGSMIVSISVKPSAGGAEEEWWLAFADASSIRIGAASGQISSVGQAARLDPLRPADASAPYPFAVHPSTSALVVPSSHPSTLQFIDPVQSTGVLDLEVAPSNRISRRDDAPLETVRVEKVAFGQAEGRKTEWMATVEGRKGDASTGGGYVKNLKIWQWINDKYAINTQYPRPHGLLDIVSVGFNSTPSDATNRAPYLVTVDSEGTAKMWQLRQTGKQEQGKTSKKPVDSSMFWALRSSFDYRSLAVSELAFSPDGTLLALAHAQVISLWDVDSNVLLRTLDAGVLSGLHSIAFFGASGRHLAAISDGKGVIVWDLLSCEATWSDAELRAEQLVPVPSQDAFIIAHIDQATQATVFAVHSSASAAPARQLVVQEPLRHIRCLPASELDRLALAGVTGTGEIFRFGDALTTSRQTAKAVSQSVGQQNRSIWTEMFGKDAFLSSLGDVAATVATTPNSAQASQALQIRARKTGKPIEVFDGPSHTLPPAGMIFDAFVEELLRPDLEMRERGELVDVDMDEQKPIYERATSRRDKIIVQPVLKTEEGRKVADKEIKELESFFREILTGGKPPKAPPKTPVSATATPHVNGKVDSSANTPATPLPKVNGSTVPNGISAASDSDDEVSSEESETEERHAIFKVGKKRKARKEPK